MIFETQHTDWNIAHDDIMALRHTVFVEEQGVSREEDVDGLDELSATLHFLGVLDGKPIATGRILASGKIGRICVLKAYRSRGYGEKMLRDMLIHTLDHTDIQTLYLHAQLSALPLYRKCGFKEHGEVFMEADIKHKRMDIAFDNQASLSAIYGDRVIRLNHPTDFTHHMRRMIKTGKRSLDILTHHLSPLVFTGALSETISHFARNNRGAKVRILVRDTTPLIGAKHSLVLLSQRLPSSIDLRALTESPQKPDEGFFCIDKYQLVFFNNEAEHQGFANYQASAESQHQWEAFEYLWQYHSKTDPNLIRLML